jgi:hypothetical protein
LANGSLRTSNFQCQLSGDETEGSAVATRPEAVLQGTLSHAEKLPFNVKVRGRSQGISEAQTEVSRNHLTADLFCDALS